MKQLAHLRCDDTLIPYPEAYREQQQLVKLRQTSESPDTFWLLQHPPVYTYGRSAGTDETQLQYLFWDEEERRAAGIELFETDRGGDITYHGPGQIVGYAIVDLQPRGNDVHRFLRDLEQVIIDTVAYFGFKGERIVGRTGVWVKGAKVCAMGIRVSRWVTMHGFALNVNPNMSHFAGIVPCGIGDAPVTSLSLLLGRAVTIEEVKPALITNAAKVFEWEFVEIPSFAAFSLA